MILVITFTYMVSFVVLQEAHYNHAIEEYDNMQNMADIPYQQAQINLHTNHIWSLSTTNYLPNANASFAPLRNAVGQLAFKLGAVLSSAAQDDYPLEYNQRILRNYSLLMVVNNSATYGSLAMDYTSAVNNYLNSAKKISDPVLLDALYTKNPNLIQE
jgi:hypothetical protein